MAAEKSRQSVIVTATARLRRWRRAAFYVSSAHGRAQGFEDVGGKTVAILQGFSGCHCTPTKKRSPGISTASISSSAERGGDGQFVCHAVDHLMVVAVDAPLMGLSESAASCEPGERRTSCQMGSSRGLRGAMAGDVLLQRAAEGDVEKLHARQMPSNGDVPGKHQVKERQLGLIAARVDAAAARLVGASRSGRGRCRSRR